MKTLRLAVRPPRSADVRAFVPVEAEPAQIPQNARFRLDGRALGVGVLDAEDECAAAPAREQPVEEGRTHAADVQMTGGAWSEAYAHYSDLSSAIACAAIASPRPSSPTPSFVLPLMLTHSRAMPSAPATFAHMAST